MEQQFRLAEIEVSRSTIDEKIVGLFRYDSETHAKPPSSNKRSPVLVVIAEISSTLYVYEQLLDAIAATIEKIRPLMAGVDADPMARFEKLIQRLNEAIADFGEREPTPIAWNRVNLFAMELSEGCLCLSGIGRLTNLFLQKQPNGAYRTFDLFGSLEQPADIDPKKPFASFICGDMQPGDVLFAGTLNFERLRSEIGIADALKTLPPVTAAMEIRQRLEQRNIPDDFAAMVVACVALPSKIAKAPEQKETPPKEKSTESVERMRMEEQSAHAMLSPAIAPRAKPLKTPVAQSVPVLRRWIARASSVVRDGMDRFARERSAKDPLTLASLRGMNAGVGSFFTRKRRLFAGAIAFVVLLSAIGAFWYRQSVRFAEAQATWNKIFDQALDRKTRAEADIVIGNEERARRFLKEAGDLVSGLDEETADRKKSKQDFLKGIQDQRDKLRREIRVDEPTVMAELALGAPENSLHHLALSKDAAYAIDETTPAILRVSLDDHKVKRIPITAEQADGAILASGKDSPLFFNGNRSLFSIEPIPGTIKNVPFAIGKASSTKSFVVYNKRAYVLDPIGNMIWKYGQNNGGFGNESPYVRQSSANLANAAAIAIDVNVFVAFADGKIMRFLAGSEEAWNIGAADPPVSSASDVWTAPETDRLVIADPAGKRILVYRKDGKLVAQIVSRSFRGPTHASGDAASKKIYAVDGNRILALDLP